MQLRLASILPALVLFACSPTTFPVEVKGESTIQGDPSPIPGLLSAFPGFGNFANLDFNQAQEFKNQGVTKDQVNSVKPDYIRLKILSPNDQDFSFLENLQFFASAEGQQEVMIAEKTGINQLGLKAPNPVLEMDVTDAELQPFITAPAMDIIVRGKGRLPAQDTKLEATVGLQVEIKVF